MSSRLDRLFILLDTGSSAVTRKAAALQLGEVQKLHPHELYSLLRKIHVYLRSNSWDTRIAAGQAIEAIVKNVPQWAPPGNVVKKECDDGIGQTGRLNFQQFDINKVLNNGACLLGSEGKEYELEENLLGMDLKKRMAKQRQLLNKKLGLDITEKMGLDIGDIYSNDDLAVSHEELQTANCSLSTNKKVIAEIVQAEIAQLGPGLSSREMNRAKRKAKMIAKQKSREAQESASANGSEGDDAEVKKRRLANVTCEQSTQEDAVFLDGVPDTTFVYEELEEWPFETFCDQLCQDLFSAAWEVRHGAATALREIVKVHGSSAGITVSMSRNQMGEANQLWLEDLALRILCALALDRFGDFISDQVVAPVRETCAQTLGVILHLMWPDGVRNVLRVITQLFVQKEWEARHGGLLSLKYLLAVREDMTTELLPNIFEFVFCGLQDKVDDVSAVAAAALVPICDSLVKILPYKILQVVSLLWDSLLELDDLTASTSSIMALLASLLAYPSSNTLSHTEQLSLNVLVPRLWPFLSHSSSSVRKATLQTLASLLSSKHQSLPTSVWLAPILQDALRHVYQRCILEHVAEILDLVKVVWCHLLESATLSDLLVASCPYLGSWLCLAMQPSLVQIDSALLIEAKHVRAKEKTGRCRIPSAGESSLTQNAAVERNYIGGAESLNETPFERESSVIRARCLAGRLLGILSRYVSQDIPGVIYPPGMESPVDCYAKLILFHLRTKSAIQRLTISLVLMEWAKNDSNCLCPASVKSQLLSCLYENIYYDELAFSFARMQQESKDFLALLMHHNFDADSAVSSMGSMFTIEQATLFLTTGFQNIVGSSKVKPRILEALEDRRKSVLNSVNQTSQEQMSLNIMVQASVAIALVALKHIPEKLNPIIKPLMDSIKKEENAQLQKMAASSLTDLLDLVIDRNPCPNPKIIRNLSLFLCGDINFTPQVRLPAKSQPASTSSLDGSDASSSSNFTRNHHSSVHTDTISGILTLVNQQKSAEKVNLRRLNSVTKGRSASLSAATSVDDSIGVPSEDEIQKSNELQRRGAQFVFTEIALHFAQNLFTKLSQIKVFFDSLAEIIKPASFNPITLCDNDDSASELISGLQLLEVIGPSLHADLHHHLISSLPHLSCCLEHPYTAVRHMAARCFGMMCRVITSQAIKVIIDHGLPLLGASENDTGRQGAIEALACVIDQMGFELVPYIVLLVVPVLGRMSDHNLAVRLMATRCFATLIRLMPLEGGIKNKIPLESGIEERKMKEQKFLEQLFNTKKLENYKVPVPIKAELRAYQQDGVNWLGFLNRYKLHGILCDDMGLGKTLQSICILAGDHYLRDQEYKRSKSADSVPLPSLVVCPPTLTGHWVYEIEKFVSHEYLQPLHYTGPPFERQRLRSKVAKYNVVIASYDIVRNDIDFFASKQWNYCILDEGHIIKNGKTKLSKAIKQLTANHRLILSGTPIQNNVLELWSLFDFLMPGFLGTEKQFSVCYSRPILLSRDAKSSSKEQEAGALAMEALHRQALPFLLRRMKEDVLQDLPPKIMQDYYCDLSPLQVQLYEDFAKSRAKKSLDDSFTNDDSTSVQGTSHIFQALQYLRKVCNHPKLVLNPNHPEYERTLTFLKEQNSGLSDIQHAAKLPALKQLLLDCGVGVESTGQDLVVNQHRVLVFCQLKSMLDILEKDLFQNHMPKIMYLRLDGTIPAGQRHAVVHRFNSDPSIDVLLLTTQVGGLGINLTGADTVIFVEHDWNPMKDLQAMDRAHRIGQKKVVNVYRLITKGTLEEKIMGLQKFKLTIANTVISQENSSLQSMGTDQLLDLFTLESSKKGQTVGPSVKCGGGVSSANNGGMKAVLETLPELWDDAQYETEYDIANFLQSLKS